jgi:hypothetical protein
LYVLVEFIDIAACHWHILVEPAELGAYNRCRCVGVEVALPDDDLKEEDARASSANHKVVTP